MDVYSRMLVFDILDKSFNSLCMGGIPKTMPNELSVGDKWRALTK
jgi:hypothetical protein